MVAIDELGTPVATRKFDCVSDEVVTMVVVEVWAPTEVPVSSETPYGAWDCRYRIRGIDRDQVRVARSDDSIGALESAFNVSKIIINDLVESFRGELRLGGERFFGYAKNGQEVWSEDGR
jgi:hypothetical protein